MAPSTCFDGTLVSSLSDSDVRTRLFGHGESNVTGTSHELLNRLLSFEVHLLFANECLPDSRAASSLTVPQLRTFLTEQHAGATGLKSDLATRVKANLESSMGMPPRAPSAPLSPAQIASALASATAQSTAAGNLPLAVHCPGGILFTSLTDPDVATRLTAYGALNLSGSP